MFVLAMGFTISFSFRVHIMSHRYTRTDMHTQCTPFQWSFTSLHKHRLASCHLICPSPFIPELQYLPQA